MSPSPEMHHAMLRRFYTQGSAPGVVEVHLGQLISDIARRLSFSRDV
ncbi:hypothetical protein [Limimaricola cinnabarinus]|uniref:Uncharacterized protein n=1 Tax=Limimaricola cinnabarinus LL-001 TaxID=1337093 RepID=U2Z6S8_9RHOB|nr:hypothetical protein [Limimaricola cinnabarinus]GAD56762.1 hypothetical protein MBELCI_2814 [Limimaricola cinnabarinus LL-001]